MYLICVHLSRVTEAREEGLWSHSVCSFRNGWGAGRAQISVCVCSWVFMHACE